MAAVSDDENMNGDEDEDDDNFFSVKTKTKEQKEKEDKEFNEFYSTTGKDVRKFSVGGSSGVGRRNGIGYQKNENFFLFGIHCDLPLKYLFI